MEGKKREGGRKEFPIFKSVKRKNVFGDDQGIKIEV